MRQLPLRHAFSVFASILFAASTAVFADPTAKPIQLLELQNRPLVPKSGAAGGQAETSSLVFFDDASCKGGCVLIGYGNGFSASLMRGSLACLGQADCLAPVALAADAPGGKVTGAGKVIGTDGVVSPSSLGGKLVNGACVGGTPSTQDEFLSGGGTDSVVARGADGSLLFIRAGVRLFADPGASCVLDLRVGDLGFAGTEPSGSFRMVNVVYRSSGDGTSWPKAAARILTGVAPGEPQTHSSVDRPDVFTNPFDDTIYVSGGAGTGKRGVNTSLLFASVDDGESWSKRGSPFDNAYGAYPPLLLAATKNRLYAAVCADKVYPPQKAHPVLGWSKDGGITWSTSEGGPLSDFNCDVTTPEGNLAGASTASPMPLAPLVAIAPIYSSSSADVIRLAFTSHRAGSPDLPEGLLGIADHQELTVVNVTVTPSGNTAVSTVNTIKVPKFGSVVRVGFVRADPASFEDKREANAAVLWWMEADNPNFAKPAKMRTNFMVSYGAGDWTAPAPLAVAFNGPPISAFSPVEWLHTASAWPGHYDNGSFFRSEGRLNYLVQWPQDDAATGMTRVHFNVVSVAPKPQPAELPSLADVSLIPIDVQEPGKEEASQCFSCPAAELTFFSRVAGRVLIELRSGRRLLDSFRVEAVEGVNVVRIGGRRPAAGGRLTLDVRMRMEGQRQRLQQQVSGVARRPFVIHRGGQERPSEPVRRPRG